ncbi:histidine N-alpha-methyltransferase-like [Ylistrum balloti]|uniref:histidine N-alpha-methyltransferase-like n=1 Tax=Ylistrum balloti TaxID=509963 RepID=UPI002905D512|nr:histidine N-alpha-methyltransferase-like [Ylistrum balloti]
MADNKKQKLVTGLTSHPKYIPAWYNYDDVGSKLQHESGEINRDYYLTRSQISFLELNVQDIIPRDSNELTLVDLGSGNCSKTRYVIDELMKRQKMVQFYPVDISGDFLMKASAVLSEVYDNSLVIRPIAADYEQGIIQLKHASGVKFILWFASMMNMSYDDQVNTLRMISSIMTDKCRLVISVDITQDKEAILKAYNDDAGVKRRFYQYGIERLNKEEGSVIDLARFTYGIDFVSDLSPGYMSYVRAYMQAKEDMQCPIPGLEIDLDIKKGERIYFHEGEGLSCKYTLEQIQNIVHKAGLCLTGTWMDEGKHVAFCQCAVVQNGFYWCCASHIVGGDIHSDVLQTLIEAEGLTRKRSIGVKLDNASLPDFPKLSEPELSDLTMGVYQLKQAKSYTKVHLAEDGQYELMLCREKPDLIKVQIRSRYVASKM